MGSNTLFVTSLLLF